MPLWLGLAFFGAAKMQSGPMTIDEAVQVALQHGFTVLIAETRVERQKGVVSEMVSHLGPQANVSGSYLRYDREGTVTFGGQTIVTSPLETRSMAATASVPIDVNGNLHHLLGAAKSGLKANEENFAAAANDIKLNTRNAFLEVLRAQKLIEVQEQALKDAQDQLKNTQLLEQGGVSAHVDTLRAESQVQQSQSDLITAKNALAIANANFNTILARPVDTQVNLMDLQTLPSAPTDEAKLRDDAHASRPEAKSLLQARQSFAETRRAAETGLLPNLNFSINYTRSFDTGAFALPYTLDGALTLSVPIFDSGLTKARVKEAKQDEEQARIQYEQELEAISQEVRQAMANLTDASQRLDSATKQVQYSDENLRLARLRYQAGEGILLQVTDAETQLTQARNQEVGARYDYLSSYSQLQHALGSDNLSVAQTGAPPDAPKEPKQ